MAARKPRPVICRREPVAARLEISEERIVDEGLQRVLELAVSECIVTFEGIVTSNGGKVPDGHVVTFQVQLVPRS